MPSLRSNSDGGECLHVPDAHSAVSVACSLDTHNDCDQQHCQVARVAALCQDLSKSQIRVAVSTAITGLFISSVFDLALIIVWYHHAMAGNVMPDVPWFIISIATATHAAGGLSALKIPKRVRGDNG
jgi:hypothetical protein